MPIDDEYGLMPDSIQTPTDSSETPQKTIIEAYEVFIAGLDPAEEHPLYQAFIHGAMHTMDLLVINRDGDTTYDELFPQIFTPEANLKGKN
jgi:hypothetical protein